MEKENIYKLGDKVKTLSGYEGIIKDLTSYLADLDPNDPKSYYEDEEGRLVLRDGDVSYRYDIELIDETCIVEDEINIIVI
jgi:hypothetical protein